MADMIWTQTLSVGNKQLDIEHRNLLGMIGRVEDAMRARDVALLSQALSAFAKGVRIHFGNEAKIAEAIGHPFEQHRQEHQYVLNELDKMKTELIDLEGRWSESATTHYLYFLSAWASDHIGEDDMLMKPKLQSLPYDFKPDGLLEG